MGYIISLFNHKGGVSKTTTTFNLGWTLASKNHKVLVVDADPQCNLTAYTIGLNSHDDFDTFYDSKKNDDIYSSISPIIDGLRLESQAILQTKTQNSNLFIAAGNIGMAELDVSLSIGLASGKFVNFAKQFIGAFYATIKTTMERYEYDFVLVDMSPSASALNRCILMSSDYFIVPTSPDFFCYQAINSLANMLPSWSEDFQVFRDRKIKNPLPKHPPRMLGIISQKYRPYKSNAGKDKAKSFQRWIDKIQMASKYVLASSLHKVEMVVDEDIFTKHVQDENPYNLISIPDFNSLIAVSQEHNKPIFKLSKKELDSQGVIYKKQLENQEKFANLFDDLADKICNIIRDDQTNI